MPSGVLLLGNGINRASESKAWIDLLKELQKELEIEAVDQYINYPLEFERIDLALLSNRVEKQNNLKRIVSQRVSEPTDLSLHAKFMNLPLGDVLTTNYDYALEKSVVENFCRKNSISHTNEKKHSLFRYIDVGDKRIWHIHGEAHCPNSICIGYTQYCSYLSRIHDFVTKPCRNVCYLPYLHHVVTTNQEYKKAWPICFFTQDIYIVGLTLSFLEIELWWLLSYRKRCIEHEEKGAITNRIHYYYPDGKCDDEQLSLLDSMGVDIHPIALIRNNWKRFYERVYDEVERQLDG